MPYIFSLTSYPARFDYLDQVIRSLKKQSIPADQVVINIAKADKKHFKLNNYYGIEVNFVEDLKAMKKLLPTLKSHSNHNIITVDDDTMYPPHLSERLLRGSTENPGAVVAGRARKVTRSNEGFAPYLEWPLLFDGHEKSKDVLPTGVGGVLYPKNVFHNDVFDKDQYMNYITKDDFWWYAQARRKGTEFVQVPVFDKNNFPNISPIANKGLYYYGNKYANDEALSSLVSMYGDFTIL